MAALLFVSIPMVILMSDSGLGQSLSRLKTVNTSSKNKEWVGSLAVDGNYDTDASGCNCCAGTSTANLVDQWLEIDFGEPTEFNHIVVYGQTNGPWSRQNLIGLSIYLDDSETSIASIVNTGQGFVNFHHFDLGQRYKATLIKLILKGRNKVLVICEVDVFNENIISKGKDVTAISTYPGWNSSHAVDGDMRTNADVCLCCAATNYHANPWLHVDLGNDFLITFIQMFGRTDNPADGQSLDGMRISVDDVIIHTVPTSNTFISYSKIVLLPETVGRYVNFTLIGEYKLLVMCEVLIHGVCKAGTYGTNCGETCGNCKENNACNPENGQCTECEDGYIETDKTCKTNCPDGWYGYNCSKTCGNCRNGQICNFQTGQCQECEDGYTYTDPLCKTVCDDGTYGTNCNKTCGSCRGDEICNIVNGYCTECEDGYMDSDKNCKTICKAGTYGTNCGETCGNCKENNTCNPENGQCTECEDGYIETDKTCKTNCPDGRYGYNCSKTCGNCRNGQICNFQTGQCQECEDGYTYTDPLCKTVCDDGTYGTNCNKTCGSCRGDEICNIVNGYCTECEDGYMDSDKNCKTKCSTGYYGSNCTMICGSCKNEATCNHVDGRCEDCANGKYVYEDKLCDKECEPHTYGYNCTGHCGNCRDGIPCDRGNGSCVECEDGYTNTDRRCNTVCGWGTYGNNCTIDCGYCFDNQTCDIVNGSCVKCAQGYLGIMCADRLEQPPDGDGDSNTAVIIGVIVPVVLIIAIGTVVAVVIIKRRRPTKQSRENRITIPESIYENTVVIDKPGEGKEEIEEEPVQVSVEEKGENAYYDFMNTVQGIPIHQLWDHIAINKGDGFLKEYETLKEGLLHPHSDALANRKRIRYREMFPYDHSRVHLKVERQGETDFINASHIDGFEREAKFIASQGPIDVMVVDFWRMVWQQNTTKIVMLTNMVENGHNKCIQYWPEEDTVDYEHINITMVHEQTESDYSIRTLDIAQDAKPPRRVKQYHYKAWPDKDVPDSTWSLIQFWREVLRDEDNRPVVVHCSAGVGRTGTFIAMDNLYHQAITMGRVTPLTIVERLRDQRVKMVQTSDQYEFLHEAVADTLMFGTHYIWQSQYAGYYDFMMKKDQAIGGKVRLAHQFELLKKNIEGKPSMEKEGDAYKPTASIGARHEQREQAPISLTSIGGSNSFLLTTIPNTKTLTEMFRMVDEYNVRTVITLVDSTRPGSSVLGSINKLTCGKYQPILVFSKTVSSVTEKTFKYTKHVTTQANGCDGKVKQLELLLSPSAEPSKQADAVSRVFDVISKWHPYISTKEPVLIQCQDGVTQCGIMAVLLNENLRLLKNGGQIHILDSVMKVKCVYRSCISSYKQYKFIHDILLHVLEEKDRVNPDAAVAADLADENIYQNT